MNPNSVIKNMESAPQERQYMKSEEGVFAKEVEKAKKNLKNSLEIKHYIETARSLLLEHSAQELFEIGENSREELDILCGDGNDSSVIVAICFYLEDNIIRSQNN
ncbi:MAG: hypothetical protein WCL13_00965 [bacterium]